MCVTVGLRIGKSQIEFSNAVVTLELVDAPNPSTC